MTRSANDLPQSFKNLDKILSNPASWTTEAGARDANGEIVSPLAPTACCWCLIGGSWKAILMTDFGDKNAIHREMLLCLRTILDRRQVYLTIAEFNDRADFDQVKGLIGEAIVVSSKPFDVVAAERSMAKIMQRRLTTA